MEVKPWRWRTGGNQSPAPLPRRRRGIGSPANPGRSRAPSAASCHIYGEEHSMAVKVTFTYEPDEPEDDPTGMSEDEFQRVFDAVMAIGGEDIKIERVD